MSENKYKIGGFVFTDLQEYKVAKSEAESIEYMKTTTDLNDLNKAIKLYHKLVERKTIKTVVGYAFLKELQERIIKEGIIDYDNLPLILIDNEAKKSKLFSRPEHDQEKKQKDIETDLRIRLRNSRIISIFLVAVILVMFLMAIFSDRTKYTNFENKILNKYSSWEEDLTKREKALQNKDETQSKE